MIKSITWGIELFSTSGIDYNEIFEGKGCPATPTPNPSGVMRQSEVRRMEGGGQLVQHELLSKALHCCGLGGPTEIYFLKPDP